MQGIIKFIVFLAVLGAAYYFGAPHVRKALYGPATNAPPAERTAGETIPADSSLGGTDSKPAPPPSIATVPEPAAKPEPAQPPLSEVEKTVLELYPMPEFPPLAALVGDWRDIPERAFPRELVIHKEMEFDLRRNGQVIGQRPLSEGNKVIASGLRDGVLTVSPVGSELLTGLIPVDDTDFKETIEEGYRAYIERTRKRVLASRQAERRRIERQIAEAAYRPAGWTDGSAPVFSVMRESLARGEATDRLLEDARKWRWIGREKVNGQNYETGIVSIEVETIFGVFASEIKALIRDGRVEKWVDPVSGQKI